MPLEPTFLERLHQQAELTGADVVNCAHNMVDTRGSTRLNDSRVHRVYAPVNKQLTSFCKMNFPPMLGIKIIRRSLFNDVRYPDIERAEDECALREHPQNMR